MRVTVDVPDERIRDLIESAGSGGWARDLVILNDLGAFTITEHDCTPEVTHTVTRGMICEGLARMAAAPANEGGHHFAAVLDPYKSDMWTGDAVIQFAIFGELKYG